MDMPHGGRCFVSVPESKHQHLHVDLGMLRESLESWRLRHASTGRGQKENCSESKLGLVIMPNMESGSSEAGDLYYKDEDLVYCESDYGLERATKMRKPFSAP